MIENARVASTFLGVEDHGIMTFFLHLEIAGSGQGLGGYALDRDGGSAAAGDGFLAIRQILKVLQIRSWEALPGTYCRVRHDDGPGSSRRLLAIGHITEDRWFDLAAFMEG